MAVTQSVDHNHHSLCILIERHEMLRNRLFLRTERPYLSNNDCDALYCETYAARFRDMYRSHEEELIAAFGCPPTKPITEEALRAIIGEWGATYSRAA
jgi:hypothetical protein